MPRLNKPLLYAAAAAVVGFFFVRNMTSASASQVRYNGNTYGSRTDAQDVKDRDLIMSAAPSGQPPATTGGSGEGLWSPGNPGGIVAQPGQPAPGSGGGSGGNRGGNEDGLRYGIGGQVDPNTGQRTFY